MASHGWTGPGPGNNNSIHEEELLLWQRVWPERSARRDAVRDPRLPRTPEDRRRLRCLPFSSYSLRLAHPVKAHWKRERVAVDELVEAAGIGGVGAEGNPQNWKIERRSRFDDIAHPRLAPALKLRCAVGQEHERADGGRRWRGPEQYHVIRVRTPGVTDLEESSADQE